MSIITDTGYQLRVHLLSDEEVPTPFFEDYTFDFEEDAKVFAAAYTLEHLAAYPHRGEVNYFELTQGTYYEGNFEPEQYKLSSDVFADFGEWKKYD